MSPAEREELRGLREDAQRHENAYIYATNAWQSRMRELQAARSGSKPASVLTEMQAAVNDAAQRQVVAQQLMEGSRHRIARREKVALEGLRVQLLKKYQEAAEIFTSALADVLDVNRRLGRDVPAALGRMYLPQIDPLPEREPGALIAFQSFLDSPTYSGAVGRVSAAFTDYLADKPQPQPEPHDDHEPPKASDSL